MELRHCFRCGNVWRPRKEIVHRCPLCKSKLWDVARRPVVTPFDPENKPWKQVIEPHRREILAAARRFHARNVRVFGSVRRGEAREDSDLDLLVTMDPGSTILDQIALKQELEELLRRRVDVLSDTAVYWYLEPQIKSEAIPL